jgi:hypothetical protein
VPVEQSLAASGESVLLLAARLTGPARYICSGCHGSTVPPAPGEPPAGWLVLLAVARLLSSADALLLVCRGSSNEAVKFVDSIALASYTDNFINDHHPRTQF